MDRTIMVVKPHLVVAGQADEVKQMIRDAGLDIAQINCICLTQAQAEELYDGHKDRDYFPWLVDQLVDKLVEVYLLVGEDADRRARKLAGPTKPETARVKAPDSIRAQLTPAEET